MDEKIEKCPKCGSRNLNVDFHIHRDKKGAKGKEPREIEYRVYECWDCEEWMTHIPSYTEVFGKETRIEKLERRFRILFTPVFKARYFAKKVANKILSTQLNIIFSISIVSLIVVVSLSLIFSIYGFDTWKGIIVEAHGMLFDLFVIVTLIFYLSKIAEKKFEIKRYKEEIDDFRGWASEDATFRIVGNIKRLNRLGVSKIDLSDCYLKNAQLEKANLEGACFWRANLTGTNFYYANLKGTSFGGADLTDANFDWANMEHVSFGGDFKDTATVVNTKFRCANLKGSHGRSTRFIKADFEQANLRHMSFQYASFENCSLKHVNLSNTKLEIGIKECDLSYADLRGLFGRGIEMFSEVSSLYNAKLDHELYEKIKEKYPHLLEKPRE